ncbi:MAG: helix-turn-helix domain-containing protein [Candidatus Rokubacteria bacterium]|nr:helix-turn-helix domain-containing protein [Candidatus Rokubacteria bacterium]
MDCGGALKVTRAPYRYTASGLPAVVLLGVEVRRCQECGAEEVAIPRIEELHRLIAQALIRRPHRLAPAEIKYLRKWLGWSGVDFARHMGTAPETVSRWEQGRAPMSPQADRLLRLMVTTRAPVENYTLDALTTIREKAPVRPTPLRMRWDRGRWLAQAA